MVVDSRNFTGNLSNITKSFPNNENIEEIDTNFNIIIDVDEDFVDTCEEEILFDNVIQNSSQKINENVESFNSSEWAANEVDIPKATSTTNNKFDFIPFRSKFHELFIDSYELEKVEGEIFELRSIDSFSDGLHSTYKKDIIKNDIKNRPGYNFVTLLNSVAKNIGYEVKEDSETIYSNDSLRQLLYNKNTTTFGKKSVTFTHPSKKNAKQMCARHILYQLVNEGYYEKYGIPGKNKEECTKFLDSIMPYLPKESITNKRADRDRNPTAILHEFCQKRHFPPPAWEKDDVKYIENNQPIHSGTLHVHIWKTKGIGTSIKNARNDAGEKMLEIVQEFEDNNPLINPDVFE
uniref:DRBM domain-containing protein n=1 Tax=Strongyloides papillosus TaxID=174720 RepID=A0A0N5C8T9_STREA